MNSTRTMSGCALAAAIAVLSTVPADSATPAACSVLSLGDMQAALGAPVRIVFAQPPATQDGFTRSACTYAAGSKNQLAATVAIDQGPADKLTLAKHHWDTQTPRRLVSGLRNDVLVMASVNHTGSGGTGFDVNASNTLLATVLKKLGRQL
jgi:hypothetical protein